MTVCTDCLFPWFYNSADQPIDMGGAILAASDRMYTDSGLAIEYEAARWKVLLLDLTHMVMVAGPISFSTEVLLDLRAAVPKDGSLSTRDIAYLLGPIVGRHRRRRAAQRILHPVNLTEETFISEQSSLQPSWVSELSENMKNQYVEADYMVAGVDGVDASLLHVDEFGSVTNHSDIGFLSIGTGGCIPRRNLC